LKGRARSPLSLVESRGYKQAGGYGGLLRYARAGGSGLAIAPYDWPMHRVFPGHRGLMATPRRGLRVTGILKAREPRRLEVTGVARLRRLGGGVYVVEVLEGSVDEWGLLDPYPEPPITNALEAALEAEPHMLILLAAYTRPHSAASLRYIPPQPAAIVDVCLEGRPLAWRAWSLAPEWIPRVCIDSQGPEDLPGAEARAGAVEEALEKLREILKPRG
jgi:hypothetical protein